jgi:hypothetical protein
MAAQLVNTRGAAARLGVSESFLNKLRIVGTGRLSSNSLAQSGTTLRCWTFGSLRGPERQPPSRSRSHGRRSVGASESPSPINAPVARSRVASRHDRGRGANLRLVAPDRKRRRDAQEIDRSMPDLRKCPHRQHRNADDGSRRLFRLHAAAERRPSRAHDRERSRQPRKQVRSETAAWSEGRMKPPRRSP